MFAFAPNSFILLAEILFFPAEILLFPAELLLFLYKLLFFLAELLLFLAEPIINNLLVTIELEIYKYLSQLTFEDLPCIEPIVDRVLVTIAEIDIYKYLPQITFEDLPRNVLLETLLGNYYPTNFCENVVKYMINEIHEVERCIIDHITGTALHPRTKAIIRFILECTFSPYNLSRIYDYHRTLSIFLESIRP